MRLRFIRCKIDLVDDDGAKVAVGLEVVTCACNLAAVCSLAFASPSRFKSIASSSWLLPLSPLLEELLLTSAFCLLLRSTSKVLLLSPLRGSCCLASSCFLPFAQRKYWLNPDVLKKFDDLPPPKKIEDRSPLPPPKKKDDLPPP